MTLKEGVPINVAEARWVSGYTLEISFSDGFSHQVDFEPFLGGSELPGVRKYLDVERFKAFSISFGNLVWNDYDLCFSVEDLYTGSINTYRQSQGMVAEDGLEYQVGRKRND